MKQYTPSAINLTKYIFFTGKGGVGKTSIACATAVNLADNGHKVLLISTDPASNLQDVFGLELDNKGIDIEEVPNLMVVNLDPEKAAAEYRESVIAPFRGKLPESVVGNMEEQLSGSCTIEIAAFNEFADFITNQDKKDRFDFIIFDTAPTGHTLRMLQLPSAWNTFIDENTTGVSCLGQLSGLADKREMYKKAVETLSDASCTTLMLVARPDDSPLKEIARSSKELFDVNIKAQNLIINGILDHYDDEDMVSKQIYERQQNALNKWRNLLLTLDTYTVPLRSYNMTGVDNIRKMLSSDDHTVASAPNVIEPSFKTLNSIVNDLYESQKRVIFTMGKGGVGKTTIAGEIARGLVKKGVKVHLTTTDPANHLSLVETRLEGLTVSHIDEKAVLESYKKTVLEKARATMGNADLSYIEEDLRSPCTQEIAVFNAFAEIVAKANDEVIVIDTAPTGHTLLLLDSAQSYHKEVERTQGSITPAVQSLLPRLRNASETEVVIVTLPEPTPVFEAIRLKEDLERAGLNNRWWVVNSCLLLTNTKSAFLKAKADSELQWIDKVDEISSGNFVVIGWENERA